MSSARVSATNINPDLANERNKATINVEKLINLLDGDVKVTQRRREIEELVLKDKAVVEGPEYHFLSRDEKYSECVRLTAHFVRLVRETPTLAPVDLITIQQNMFPMTNNVVGLHTAMFLPMITGQGTKEQQSYWLNKSDKYGINGTYAQTELGHGTHVRGLETTATYDQRTEEFILHTPTISATKWWPGSLGKTTDHAIIMAQLYSNGVCHGVHAFVVQLRDLDTHEPLPGIMLGDIGPKFGFDTVDNGFLRFDHLRIPRERMLMKHSQILKDGSYVKEPKSDKLGYGAMVGMRAFIVSAAAAKGLAAAVTIAVRYSCVRRQSELKPGEPEPLILDYQTQQYKLLPQLATAYALWFAGQKMRAVYLQQQGNAQALPELHATSAGLKAVSSAAAMYGVEQCRLACGGHGYSHASGLPKIYVQTTPACTYEGENTVMLLQTARYLMKACQQANRGERVDSIVSYLTETRSSSIGIDHHLNPKQLVEAYRCRARRLVTKAAARYSKLLGEGKPPHEAWNLSSVLHVKAAEAHCHLYIIETFMERVAAVTDSQIVPVLRQLFQLYATYGISNQAADFLEDMTSSELDVINSGVLGLLSELRVNAVALVDAFDFTDRLLGSILGRYDGNVYENMYNWAASSPLNKTQVHESFKYIQDLRQAQSKL